jgi:hypothetical protein
MAKGIWQTAAAVALLWLAAPAAGQDLSLRAIPARLQLELSVDSGLDGQGLLAPTAGRGSATPAYGGAALVVLRSLAGSASWVGSGVGYYRATTPVPGRTSAQTELLLTPQLVTLPLALKLAIAPTLYAALEPALTVAWVGGALRRTNGPTLDFSSPPALGLQFSAGFELQAAEHLGLSLRGGYRSVHPGLICRPNLASSTDPGTAPRPEQVDADLSGIFWAAGIIVRL